MTSPETSVPDAAIVRLSDPGELVATVPVLLGFHPTESLVLLATGGPSGTRAGLTLRADLPPPRRDVGPVAEAAVRGLMLDSPVGAAVIVVGRPRRSAPPARALVDRVVAELEHRKVDVHTVVWAESTAAGARWGCYDPCGCDGVLPDPDTTEAALASVVGGQVVRADRGELARLVAPADAERIRCREVRLIEVHDRAAAGPLDDDSATDGRAKEGRAVHIALLDAALRDTADGRLVIDDERAVALAVALTDPLVRDTAILRSCGPLAVAAENLWAALVRELPDPEAAEAAALLAVSALLRGDGALANVAIDRAEQAWPGHRLTALLRQACDTGMRPDALRACLDNGVPLCP